MAEAFICKRGRPTRPHRPGVVSGTINKHYIPYRDQPTHSPTRCQTVPGHAGREAAKDKGFAARRLDPLSPRSPNLLKTAAAGADQYEA